MEATSKSLIKVISKQSLENCSVHFSRAYNRKLDNPVLEAAISDGWKKLKIQNPRIWNAPKFRLNSTVVDGDHVRLNIGLTSYKDHRGTDYTPPFELQEEYMALKIGVGGVLVTDDYKIIVMRRSEWVAHPGMIDNPSGHPEPDNISKTLAEQQPTNSEPNDTLAKQVFNEIVESQKTEICEELNLSREEIISHEMHSIMVFSPSEPTPFTENVPLRYPGFFFVSKTMLTAEQVIAKHGLGGENTDEGELLQAWDVGRAHKEFEENGNMARGALCAIGTWLYVENRLSIKSLEHYILKER